MTPGTVLLVKNAKVGDLFRLFLAFRLTRRLTTDKEKAQP
jgi:hypothetical protein